MAWDKSKRKSELPSDWAYRVTVVKQRANGQCQGRVRIAGTVGNQPSDFQRCPDRGTDCDHIRRGNDHSFSNLQLLCRWHHDRKTAREGVEARKSAPKRVEIRHPGMI